MVNQMPDDNNNSPKELKIALRRHFKRIRQDIPLSRQTQASIDACASLYNQSKHCSLILSFASFGTEINLWPLNEQLAKEKRLALPRSLDHMLSIHLVEHLSDLETHLWGWRMPSIHQPILPDDRLSLALIPGLGFDKQNGHRLGYGKGYYDQLLAKLSCPTWGIGFYEQEMTDFVYENHDHPLTKIQLF